MTGSRQGDRGSGVLSRDDLFLLMESYKNTIELNTTLLEQQKLIIDGNKNISDSNMEICKKIEEIVKKLDSCALELNKTHAVWMEGRNAVTSQMTQEHLKLKGYLNIVAVSMATLCVSIVATAIKAVSVFYSWSDQIHLLEHISKAVGAG